MPWRVKSVLLNERQPLGDAKSTLVVRDMVAAGKAAGEHPRQESSDPLIFEPNCWIIGPISSGTELAVVTVASIG